MSAPQPSFVSRSPRVAQFHASIVEAFQAGDPQAGSKSVENANVEIVRRLYATLGAGNIDALMSFFAPDVVVEMFVPVEFGFRCHADGLAECRQLILNNFSLLESQEPQVTGVVAQGDTVCVNLAETGRIRATQSPYRVQAAQRFTFKDGKVWGFSQVVAFAG